MSPVTASGGHVPAEVPPVFWSLEVGDEGAGTASRSCFIAHLESSLRPVDNAVNTDTNHYCDTNHYWRPPHA